MNNTTETQKKLNDLGEVIAFCKAYHLPGEIVGRWVWIEFPEKPSGETRELLKGAGFRWIHKRGKWAHSCGIPSKNAPYDPRLKYGSIPIDEIDIKAIA